MPPMKKNEPEGVRRHRLRRWVAPGVLMLAGALGVGWLAWGNRGDIPTVASPDAASLSAGPSASAPLARQQGASAPDTAVATATVAASTPASAASKPASKRPWGLSPEELDQYAKQWCSHGHTAHQQTQEAVDRAYPMPEGEGPADKAAREARANAKIEDPAYQARFGMRERLKQAWVTQLETRGDLRSRAAAAFIGTDLTFGDARLTLIQSLRAAAEGSTDPLIWHLWRMARRHCFDNDDCGPATLKRWSDIEPSNLLAWLPSFREPSEIPDDRWAGIRQATLARSYQEDFMQLLLPLLERESPGLALQEGLALLENLIRFWPTTGSLNALSGSCNAAATSAAPQRKVDCLHVAELLWNMPKPDLQARMTALRMAALLKADGDAPWADRFSYAKSLDGKDLGDRFSAVHFRSGWDRKGCEAQPGQRDLLRTIAKSGEWEALVRMQQPARAP